MESQSHLSPKQALFLATFLHPRALDDPADVPPYLAATNWAAVLEKSPKVVSAGFIESGLIAHSSLETHLDANFNMDEIRKRLKKLGLKTSGNKQQLLQEWVRGDAESSKHAVGNFYLFELTELGRKSIDLALSSPSSLDGDPRYRKQDIIRSLK